MERKDIPDFFRLLKDVLDVGLFLTTPEGLVLDANRAVLKMMGIERDGQHTGAVEVAECYVDPSQRKALMEELREKGVVRGRVMRMKRLRTGEPFWARINAVAVKDDRGHVLCVLGTMEEVEEEMRQRELLERRRAIVEAMAFSAEDLLRSSRTQELFPKLLTRLGEAVGVDRAFLFRRKGWDDTVVLRYEWAAEGIPSLRDGAFPGEIALRDHGLGRWAEAFARGGMIVGDVEVLPPREREFLQPLGLKSVLFIPVRTAGEWIGFLGFAQQRSRPAWTSDEINALRWAAGLIAAATERRKMEEALERERELLLETLKDAPYGVLLVEGRRHIFANEEFTKITGYTLQDVPTVSEWLHKAFPKKAMREKIRGIWTIERAATREAVELPIVAKDGSRRWVEFRPSILPRGQVMICLVDVTPQREMERQLRTAQRLEALGELAGGIAHDFNNLLTTIRSFAQIGMAKVPPEDPIRRHFEVIERESKRGAELTRKILAYARRQPLSLQLLDLNNALEEILEILERTIGEHIRIKTSLAPELAPVEADPTALEQILMNLALNARDAMPQGGTLTIKTYPKTVKRKTPVLKPGKYVVLEVGDTGIGMDEETMQRIFDPFFTTKEGGTGLGLSVVYGLVKQHRGAITVSSEPGRGTSFQIFFPTAEVRERPEGETGPKEGGPGKGSGTVLVVEDEPSLRELMKEILKEHGYHPLTAKDGKEAVRLLKDRGGRIDLVITDLVMPRMGGKELYEWALGAYPSIPFIFVSGYAPTEEVRDFISKRGLPFIGKPFGPTEFLRKVEEVLSQRSGD